MCIYCSMLSKKINIEYSPDCPYQLLENKYTSHLNTLD